MKKMKAFLAWLADVADDFLAYVLTVIGILCSAYIPVLKAGGPIVFDLGAGKIFLAAVVALLLVGKAEYVSDSLEAKAGRRRNFVSRMVNALSQGVAWATIVQLAG